MFSTNARVQSLPWRSPARRNVWACRLPSRSRARPCPSPRGSRFRKSGRFQPNAWESAWAESAPKNSTWLLRDSSNSWRDGDQRSTPHSRNLSGLSSRVRRQELLHGGVVHLQFFGLKKPLLQVLLVDFEGHLALATQQLFRDLALLGGEIGFARRGMRQDVEDHAVCAGGDRVARLSRGERTRRRHR